MRYPGLLALPLILFALAACSNTAGPPAHFSPLATVTSPQLHFLPPVGTPGTVTGARTDQPLEISFFNLDAAGTATGEALGPTLSTADRSITVSGGAYAANWQVAQTAADPSAGEFLRVEVRVAGTPATPSCNDGPGGACLGYFDVQLSGPGGPGRPASDGPPVHMTVNRNRTLPIRFLVGTPPTRPVPDSLADLRRLTDGENFDEGLGNCPASDWDLLGQRLQAVGARLQAVGAVGGLFAAPSGNFSGILVTPEEIMLQLGEITRFPDEGRSVALIVVDDFAGAFELPAELFSGTVNSDLLEDLLAQGRLSHGALVLRSLLDMAGTFGFDESWQGTFGSAPTFHFSTYYGGSLTIVPVDAAGLDTGDIVTGLHSAFDYLSLRGELGIADFVVNMSFAIVPCDVTDDVTGAGLETFEEYVQALRQLNNLNPAGDEQLTRLLTSPLTADEDPLLSYLDCPLPAGDRCDGYTTGEGPAVKSIVNVAAAGNFGQSYSLYPAAWPTAIAVTSLDVSGSAYGGKSDFANTGQVAAPGAFLELTSSGGQTIAYAGTSFASPVVSLFQSLDRLGYRYCAPGSLRSSPITPPALAQVDYEDLPLAPPFGSGATALGTGCVVPQ